MCQMASCECEHEDHFSGRAHAYGAEFNEEEDLVQLGEMLVCTSCAADHLAPVLND